MTAPQGAVFSEGGIMSPEEIKHMPFSEKLARTEPGEGTHTHVRYEGRPYRVEDMERELGFTFEQLKRRDVVEAERTFCMIGEAALTLDEFMATHTKIELGYN
jgi:hypothetical protein